MRPLALATLLFLALPGFAQKLPATAGRDEAAASHKQVAAHVVKGADATMKLQTLCTDSQGRLLALVAPPRGFSAPTRGATAEVHVLSPEGKELRTWKVDFHAHSINAGPKGSVFVAGDGKIARFDAEGKRLGQTELPHIAALLKDSATLRKSAEEQIAAQKASMAQARKSIEDMKKRLEAKPEADRSAREKTQLQQYDQILKSYAEFDKQETRIDTVVQQMSSRLRIINGVAVGEKDLFVACGEGKGYGYAVWRMDHDFQEAKQVLKGLSGCCGQIDVQVRGGELLVAENTKHQFARYDRDGKPLGRHGKRADAKAAPECFGGCCNPMNVRATANGDVYTAESEGIIKRFGANGDFLGLIGHVALTGGCKNVAVAVSPSGDQVYFCDQPGSRIIVLGKK